MGKDAKLQFHEFATIFPMLEGEKMGALVEDIRQNGLRESVTIFEGKVLDGRNRYIACEKAGKPIRSKQFSGTRLEALLFVWSENFHRRHLESGQAAAAVVEFETQHESIAEELRRAAKLAQVEGQRKGGGDRKSKAYRDRSSQRIDASDQDNTARTDAKLAGMFGTNRQYVADARKLAVEQPEAFAEIKAGRKTIPQAKRELKEQAREARRKANRRKARSTKPLAETGAQFATIVIDPPWDWSDEGDENQLGRAKPDYATMTLEQLKALPVGKMADKDCHLYAWVTNRSLPKIFGLLEAWGFRYVTMLTWPKPSFGMGNYFRGQTEHVVFGVRGSQPLKVKDAATLLPSWKRGHGHSAKPMEFLAFVERCSPGPYLELFSRTQREGWSTWGADAS